jgi:hypothetical protein
LRGLPRHLDLEMLRCVVLSGHPHPPIGRDSTPPRSHSSEEQCTLAPGLL